jgi:peptide/nickel transport system permease protein
MGFFVGYLDLIGMRLVEIFGSVPTLYLLLAFVAFFPRNLYLMMVIIGFTGWVDNARFVRAEFLRLRNQDFVHAARAAGLPLRSILFRHMLPNAMAPLLVSASFGIAQAILIEATLSYLGLGLVDDPSWGQLLNQAVSEAGVFSWWLATFPGLAIFLTVFSYNLIGEAVRDALDPKLKRTG